MASNTKSRWADSEEDAAIEAKLKRDKEERKRLKAERARRMEAAQLVYKESAKNNTTANEGDNDRRPIKRRKVTPDRDSRAPDDLTDNKEVSPKMLRMPFGHWGKCRSVENYDKLNDIEEGTYGWVSRAKEVGSGKVVALKRLKIEPGDRNGLPVTGLREIQILRDCTHRNIVGLKEVVVGEDTTKIEKFVVTRNHSVPRERLTRDAAYFSFSSLSSMTSGAFWRICPSPSSCQRSRPCFVN